MALFCIATLLLGLVMTRRMCVSCRAAADDITDVLEHQHELAKVAKV